MQKNKLVIANWKMEFSHKQSIDWLKLYYPELSQLATTQPVELVVCPGFTCLPEFKKYLINTPLQIGAQDCSSYPHGPYTGQVAATSLKELNCHYCIIGHSETHSLTEHIAKKAALLMHNKIVPIACIGETLAEKQAGKTVEILQQQLTPILRAAQESNCTQIIIAYEPVWAIGTGVAPEAYDLKILCHQIKLYCSQFLDADKIRLVYGGSVNSKNCEKWLKIPEIDGFLLGKASLDFQELKKIVVLVSNG